MQLTVRELFFWTAMVAVTAATWRMDIFCGLTMTLILVLAFLSRLETVAPQWVVVGFAVLTTALMILLANLLG